MYVWLACLPLLRTERRLFQDDKHTTAPDGGRHGLTHLSEAAEHLCDSLGHHIGVLSLHQGHPVERAREELVLLRQLHAGAGGGLELVDDLSPLHTHTHINASLSYPYDSGFAISYYTATVAVLCCPTDKSGARDRSREPMNEVLYFSVQRLDSSP